MKTRKRDYFLGKHHSDEAKKKISEARKGKHHSEKTKRKMSLLRKGCRLSTEHRINISKSLMGKKLSKEHCIKIGDSHRGFKSHFWKGGITNSPYSVDWTNTLKKSIRERDHYICQICKLSQEDYAFPVHHIDHDKLNCNPENLITLCRKCHIKTNSNRKYWRNYLSILLIDPNKPYKAI